MLIAFGELDIITPFILLSQWLSAISSSWLFHIYSHLSHLFVELTVATNESATPAKVLDIVSCDFRIILSFWHEMSKQTSTFGSSGKNYWNDEVSHTKRPRLLLLQSFDLGSWRNLRALFRCRGWTSPRKWNSWTIWLFLLWSTRMLVWKYGICSMSYR